MRLNIGLLFVLLGTVIAHSAEAAPVSRSSGRVLHFPKDRSVGQVFYSNWIEEGRPHDEIVEPTGPANFYDWKLIGQAQGDVRIPGDSGNSIVRIRLNVSTAKNLSWVKRLEPDDIYEFEINPYRPQEKLKVGDADVRHLNHLTGLTRLLIYHVNVSDKGLTFLKSMKGLKTLRYYSPKLGNSGLKTIGELSWLEELSLGKGNWNDSGLRYLSGLKSLRRFGLSTIDVKGPGLAVCARFPRLEYFSSRQYVTDRHLSYLKEAISLRDLYVADCSISDKGLEDISNLSNLESLNLSGASGFSKVGLQHLVRNQKLKRLKLPDLNYRNKNALTSEDLSFLARLQHLEHLQLPSTGITEDILETVSQLPDLKHFRGGVGLKEPLSDEAIRHLTRLEKLEYLHLNTSGISDKALGYIGEITSLKILHQPKVLDGSNGSLRQLSGLKSLEAYSVPRLTNMTLSDLNPLGKLTNLKSIDASGILPPEPDDPVLELSGLKLLERILLPDVRDEDLACLAGCTQLIDLQVGMQKTISDEGLKHVAKLNGLHHLTIGGPGVTDEGLLYLAGKDNLYTLNLKGNITNKGLEPIHKLKMLSSLTIQSEQKISTTAQKSLIRSLPNLYALNLTQGSLGTSRYQKKKTDKRQKKVSVRKTSFKQDQPSSEKPASSLKARVLHFPKDRSVGRVYYSHWITEGRPHDLLVEPTGPVNIYDWKLIGEAQGDVRVPENTIVRFKLNVGTARNLSWISRLKPDDIFEFQIKPHNSALRLKVGDRDVQHLKTLTGLTRLYLTHVDVSDSGLSFLKSMKGLKALGISSPRLGNQGLRTIGMLPWLEALSFGKGDWNDFGLQYLSGLKSLRRISFSTVDVKGPGMALLERLPSLEFLSAEISDEHLRYFDQASSLRELIVDGGEITDAGLQLISKLHNLEGLKLGANPYVTDKGIAHLKKMKKLKRLNLMNCNSFRKSPPITIEGLSHLTESKNLEHLELPSRHIPEEVLEIVSQLPNLKKFWGGVGTKQPLSDEAVKKLTRLNQLEFLHLNTSGISEKALGYIGEIESLKNLHTPKILDGTDDSFKQLSSLHNLEYLSIPLKSNLSMTALNNLNGLTELKTLQANYLKPPTPESPPLDLSKMKKLDFVMLPAVRDEDLFCLKNCQQLTRLQVVPQTSISDVGMAALANMKSLESVIIGGPGVTDKSLDYLEGKKNLGSINLTGNFSNQGVASLKRFGNLWSVRIHSANQISSAVQKRLARSLPHLYSMQITNGPLTDESAQIETEPKIRLVSHERKVRKSALQTAEKVSETPSYNRKARVLRFPKDRSVGQVYIAFEKEEPFYLFKDELWEQNWDWKRLGEAQGDVTIPAGAIVRFKLSIATAQNLDWVRELKPDDLYSFEIFPFLPQHKLKVQDQHLSELKHLTGLRTLMLVEVDVKGDSLEFLASMPSLKKFYIFSPNLQNEGLRHIGKLKNLEYLSLSAGKWNDRGMNSLRDLESLQAVSISVRDVQGPGLEMISHLPNLQEFSCKGTEFEDRHAERLKSSTTIRNVLISNSRITDSGLKTLSGMEQLEHLNLGYCHGFTDAGLKYLTNLKKLKGLELLRVNQYRKENWITSKGVGYVTQIPTLEELVLPEYEMPDTIFEQVSELKNLKSLTLGRGVKKSLKPITAEMLSPLTKLSRLELLNIRDYGMEVEGLSVLGKLVSLKSLMFPRVEKLENEDLARLSRLKLLKLLQFPHQSKLTISALKHLKGMSDMRYFYAYGQPASPEEETFDFSNMPKLKRLLIPALRDQDLATLASCRDLEVLQTWRQRAFSEKGMKYLAKLNKLKELHIGGPGVTDKGLQYLEGKDDLYSLKLRGRFSDEGLEPIRKLTGLVRFELMNHRKLSRETQQSLARSLPNLYSLQISPGSLD